MRLVIAAVCLLLVSCCVFRGMDDEYYRLADKSGFLWSVITVEEILRDKRDVRIRLTLTNKSHHPLEIDGIHFPCSVRPVLRSLRQGSVRQNIKIRWGPCEPVRIRVMPDSTIVGFYEGFTPKLELSPDLYRVQFDYLGNVYDTLGNRLTSEKTLRSNTVEFEIVE